MKLKTRIASTIMSMALALGVMGIAVWAAATQTLSVSNTVSFVSDHVLATVNGTITGAEGAAEFGAERKATAADSVTNILGEWEIGNISFANELVPIEIILTIQNDSAERFFTFEIDFANAVEQQDNVIRTVTYTATSSEMLVENATYLSGAKVRVDKMTLATIVVSLEVADTGKSVHEFNNSFSVTLRNLGEVTPGEEPGTTDGFVFNSSEKTLMVPQGQTLSYNNLPDMSSVEEDAIFGFYKDYNEFTGEYSNRVLLPHTATTPNEVLFAEFGEINQNLTFTNLTELSASVAIDNIYASNYSNLEFIIPAVYQGKVVREVKDWGFASNKITKVVVPESVVSIGEGAFSNTSSLTEIVIYEGVTTIGNSAFFNCGNLTTVDMADSVYRIKESAFGNTMVPQSFEVENGISYFGKVVYWGPSSQEDSETISLRPDTKGIANGAFAYNNYITNITLPASVVSIEKSAFNGCENLSTITFLGNPSHIGSLAFNGTNWLGSQPDGIVFVGATDSVVYGYKGAMPKDYILDLSETSITALADNAFINRLDLREVHLPSTLVSISEGAFSGAEFLETVVIPEGVVRIEAAAFAGTESLYTIAIANSIEYIGEHAFAYSNLNVMEISMNLSKLKIIDSGAFSQTQLAEIFIPHSVQEVRYQAFGENRLEQVEAVYVSTSLLRVQDAFEFTVDKVVKLIILENPNDTTYTIDYLPVYRSHILESMAHRVNKQVYSTLNLRGYYFTGTESIAPVNPEENDGMPFKTVFESDGYCDNSFIGNMPEEYYDEFSNLIGVNFAPFVDANNDGYNDVETLIIPLAGGEPYMGFDQDMLTYVFLETVYEYTYFYPVQNTDPDFLGYFVWESQELIS